jgi:hypothetical protein
LAAPAYDGAVRPACSAPGLRARAPCQALASPARGRNDSSRTKVQRFSLSLEGPAARALGYDVQMVRWQPGLGFVAASILALCVGACSSEGDDDASAKAGAGSGGSSGSGSGGSAGAAAGGTGGLGNSGGTGNASGRGGSGGTSVAGMSGSAGQAAGATGDPLGESCSAGCTLSPCGKENSGCASGYCVFESRFLPFQEYCTDPCDGVGAACPLDYECVADDFGNGKFWCVKPKPAPPSDFGTPCEADFNQNDCRLQDLTLWCNAFPSPCEEQCVIAPGHPQAVCTMDCSNTLECPEGYECLDTPAGSTSQMTCFPKVDPEAVLGHRCMPNQTRQSSCGMEPLSCAVSDDYGLCDCLLDEREGATMSRYCTVPCTGACPDGYDCLEASQSPSSMGTATFCFATL